MKRNAIKSLVLILLCLTAFNGSLSADEAEYQITFEGFWTLEPLPGGAHFSPLIGATHSQSDEIFAVGSMVSPGVENVAELGSTDVLVNEINAKIQSGTVESLILRPGNVGPEQTVLVDFSVSSDYPLVSLLTMIAPSPDWFVGVNSMNLRENNQWIDEVTIQLNSYDAGTEEGDTFSLNNPPTSPQQTVMGLDSVEPTNPLAGFGSIATITVTRVNIPDFEVGDVNRDGAINLLDVNPFVAAINAGDFQVEADTNCDGDVNLLDVSAFIALLSN